MECAAFGNVIAKAQYLAAKAVFCLPLLNGGVLVERPYDQQYKDEQQYSYGKQAQEVLHVMGLSV
ncbi:hypothetical protein MnBA_10450 [Marinobacterium sp. BA1]